MAEPRLNIYQMYLANGNKAGFFVKRDSWSSQVAEVISIDGKSSGELTGKPPYFNNPKVFGRFQTDGKVFEITCAGTYGYSLIEQDENNE